MSSSAPRSGEKRMIHQDFIARIRYSNALPPPPNPPKLLDIPNTGLASGQYTTPAFVSRLAREQPLNVEADAELGMPLDLVGMPGVFDGDERSIQAPAQPPPVHAHDRLLLRPVSALGKHKVAEASVSFLRRTEYISSVASKRFDGSSNPRALLIKNKKVQRRATEVAADSPQNIKRKIDIGFSIAETEMKDKKRLKHPSRKGLTLVDAAPLLPDLDAFPDSGAYVTIKFLTNPVQSGSHYDNRLLSGIFRPIDRTEQEEEAYESALAAHKADERNPKPPNLMNYDFYLAQSKTASNRFKGMFDVDNPNNSSKEQYTHETDTGGCFQFNRLRAYETANENELDHATKYSEEILLADNDIDEYPRQKAVYYYPVMQKSTIRPQRTKNIARTVLQPEEEEDTIIDQLDVTVEDPNEEMRSAMERYRGEPLGFEDEEEETQQPADTQDDDGARNGGESPQGRKAGSVSEELDAEGEEDDD